MHVTQNVVVINILLLVTELSFIFIVIDAIQMLPSTNIVVCSDTVSRVGVFCSAMNAIDMCKTEGVVDVFQVVKALRIQKPGAVQTVVGIRL